MPQSVFADIRIVRPVSKVEDYFEVLLYYPEMRLRLHSSYLVREPQPAYAIHGSKGTLIKAKTDVQEAALMTGAIPGGKDWGKEPDSEKGFLHAEKDGKIVREFIPSLQGNYGDYYEGIYKTLRQQQPPPVSAEEGLDVIRIIEAASRSSKERKVIDL
jgi:scyllo-inositol 2-dehydrogenase (NADP+)